MLTRRNGDSQLLWDTAPENCMGIAQAAIALLARGSLGDGLVSLSAESRRRPACSSPQDDAGSRPSLTGQRPLRCRQCSPTQPNRCLITEVFLVVLADSTQSSRLSTCYGTADELAVAGRPLAGNARAEGHSNTDDVAGWCCRRAEPSLQCASV